MSSLLLLAAETAAVEPSVLVQSSWIIVVLPLLSTALIAVFGKLMPWKGAEIGIATLAVMWIMALGVGWETFTNPELSYEAALDWAPLGGGFVLELGMLVDGLTGMMLVLVTTVSLMVNIYSKEYMAGEDRFTYFFSMLSLFTFSMLLLVIANNTLQGVVGWELVGLCSYLLIGFYWEEKSNQDAANKAFLTTKFADVGLIVGVIVLSSGVASLGGDFAETPFNLGLTNGAAAANALPEYAIVGGMLLIFLGAVGKSGQMPLHVWLPDAMAGPTPVSALIHAATMVTAGIFLLARLYPVIAQSLTVMNTMAVVGTITLFLAGFLAFVQDDIKKVLAYSTVSQLGYMMAALGVGSYTAGIFHLFTHGFFKALLFLGSGSLIHAVHSNNMSDMGGMRRYMPHTFWTFLVGTLALAGFPLTAGFFSKDEILVGAQIWANNGIWTGNLVYWVGLAGAMVTTFYMGRAIFLIFFGEHRGAHHDDHEPAHDGGGADAAEPAPVVATDADGTERPVPAGGAAGADDHAEPHESGGLILTALVFLALASFPVGFMGGFLWDEVGGDTHKNFETWTATTTIEHTQYPFLDGYEPYGEVVDGELVQPEGTEAVEGGESEEAGGEDDTQALAAGTALGAASEEGGVSNQILHGVPQFHPDVFILALLGFLLAAGIAFVIYGRGKPDRDPTLHMGAVTTVLVEKYYLDTIGYHAIVVPVRDHLAKWASYSSNDGQYSIDSVVAGVGSATKAAANSTYRTLDQRIVDGGVNGAAFSAAWWSDKLKRIQSGDVQRYAGALVAGTVVLVLVIALTV
jgi:NADH-quinone oxidoreductase subunit L